MAAMTRPTGRRVYFLTDPIEDNPRYTWENYRENYHETFIAQLLHAEVASYEVVPWPRRVFQGRYPSETSQSRVRIPVDYATELLILFNALAEMHAQKPTTWHMANDAGIGVALSDTMMFQREPRDEDPHLSNLFGLTLPWIKRGMNVRLVQLENVDRPKAFEGVKILLSSFSFMKCKREVELRMMVDWVRNEGGICILFDDTMDAYNAIREWWNEGETPSENSGPATRLMDMFGIDEKPGIHKSGRGYFMWVPRDPITFASREGGSQELLDAVAEAAEKAGLSEEILRSRSAYDVGRGKYRIVAAPDESTVTRPYALDGAFVDLFDPSLPVLEDPKIERGNESFFVDLQSVDHDDMLSVLASSLRVEGLRREPSGERGAMAMQLRLRGPARIRGVLRLWSNSRPQSISWKPVDSEESAEILPVPEQDSHGTFLVNIPNVELDSEDSPLEGILTISFGGNQR
jgi:hypothetical protein